MIPDSDHQILYACVCSGTTMLSDFSSGDTDLKTLALKCIETTPPFHLLYSYTAGKRIYCFLIEDPFVFFAIIDEGFGKDQGFVFLNRLKTSFASFWKRQSIKSTDQLNSLCFQEEFGPVLRSLMHLSGEADQITKRNPDPIERDNAGAIRSPLLLDKQISNGGGEIGDVSVENVSDPTFSSNEIREGSLLPEKDGGSGVVDGGWRQARRIWKKQPAFWYLGAVAVTCIWLLICNSLDFSYSFPSAGRCCYQQCKIDRKFRAVRAMSSPTVVAPKREKDPKKRIVITGMGLASVFGNEIDIFYDKLLEGESGIGLIDRFDASSFSVRFGGQIRNFSSKGYIDGKNDRRLDDCWRYCLVAGKRALEDANLGPEVLGNMDRSRIGVLVGSGMGGLTAFSNGVESLIQKGFKKITPFFIPYSITNMGSALLAIDTGLMGPNYSISTACATANYCFCAAANHIRRDEADIMVVGGTEAAIMPTGVGGFIACRALSQRNGEPEKASRPWDKNRDGFVMGEGSGVLVMESLEHAEKRGANIIAEYLGGAITCDAHHMTDPRSDGLGVSSCITKSLEDAGVSPEEVNYVNAHATSTLAGDLAEVTAIKKVFKDTSEMKMNGTKSLIGHCLGASGGLEAIATIKAITTGWLHPTINQFNIEPEVTIDTVPNVKKKHEVHVAISNSFGFGGHNSVVVFAPFMP